MNLNIRRNFAFNLFKVKIITNNKNNDGKL